MTEMIFITASLSCLIALIILRPLAVKLNLVDYPSERKNHSGNIPLVGGISVFLGLLVSCSFFVEFEKFSSGLLITASLIFFLGVWDDFVNLKAKTKLAFQVLISVIMIYITDVKLESLGYIFGVLYPFELGIFSIPITIIAVIALTNAINMLDGIDGLAAGIVLLAALGLICFSLKLEFTPFINILLAISSALLPFIIFNIAPYPKIKVFLGDGGSLLLGYIMSWALIYSAENINNFTHSFALWYVAIPLFDFFAVIIMRIVKKHTLMIAKKDHIHHFLENLGVSKKLILLLTISCGLAILTIGSLIENKFPALSFPVFLILFFIYLFIRMYNDPEKKVKRY